MKFQIEENKKFWNEFAKKEKDNPFGAHTDYHVVKLENHFILNILKTLDTKNCLDIGCGNGQRTVLFSKYVKQKILGIDYSEEMIEEAKKLLEKKEDIKEKISFETQDVNELKEGFYDTIISCRCFINQPSVEHQINLFKKLAEKIKPGGSLIIAEQSEEGIKRLSDMREKFNLDEISIRWFNLPINESKVFSEIKSIFEIKKIERLGVFYYVSRILNPAIVHPEQPKPNSKINEIGFKSQQIFNEEFKNQILDEIGAQLLVHFVKK